VSFALLSVASSLAEEIVGAPINGEERYPPTLIDDPPAVFAGIIWLLWFLIILVFFAVVSVDLGCYPYSPCALIDSESLVRFIILWELLLLWLLYILAGIYSPPTFDGFFPSDSKNIVEELVFLYAELVALLGLT